jgi:two-component system sensor histidine kinase UhpB
MEGLSEVFSRAPEALRAIVEHAPIGIAITDEEERFAYGNPRFLRMLGYAEGELASLTGWDVVYKGDEEANRRLRDDLWSGKRDGYSWERRYVRKNGEVLWTRNTVTVIRDAGRAPRYVAALIEDISERRLTDAAIQATAEKLQALTRRMVDLQEAERREIARELHDRVGQTLTAMRINMDMIRARLAERDDQLIRGRNDESLELIDSAFKAVVNVMHDLRPPMIDEYGLVESLRWYAKKFTERTAIDVRIRGGTDLRCGAQVELGLFRIAQEALTNVAKHARARKVEIRLVRSSGWCTMSVQDDGIGFDDAVASPSTLDAGLGIVTMRERAEAVGGDLDARSEKGKGTRITVRVKALE